MTNSEKVYRKRMALAYKEIRGKAKREDEKAKQTSYTPYFHKSNGLKDAMEILRNTFRLFNK